MHAHDVPTVVHVLLEVFVLQDGMSLSDSKWLKLHLKIMSYTLNIGLLVCNESG